MAKDFYFTGFEAGDISGITALNSSVVNTRFRSGAYSASVVRTASSNAGFTTPTVIASVGVNVAYHQAFRFFANFPTLPSASGMVIGGPIGGVMRGFASMDTTGAIRLQHANGNTAYVGGVILNQWYQFDIDIQGVNWDGSTVGSGHMATTMTVRDKDGNVFASYTSGTFATNSAGAFQGLTIGDNGTGSSGTWTIYVDDLVATYGSSSDASGVSLPVQTNVLPAPVNGQGSLDDFTPTSGFASVAEIPDDNASVVSTSTLNASTTYTHKIASMLGISNIYGVKVTVNINSAANPQAILINGVEFAFTGAPHAHDASTPVAQDLTAYSNPSFNALQMGVRCKTGGSTLSVYNVVLEVLCVRVPIVTVTTLLTTLLGEDVTHRIRRDNQEITVRDVLDAPHTANLTFNGPKENGGTRPLKGENIKVIGPDSNLLFAGQVLTVTEFYDGLIDQRGWNVNLIDHTWRLRKYFPFGQYINVSMSTVVLDLVARYAPGFTTGFVQTSLPLVTISFDGSESFVDCLNRLTKLVGGCHWFADYDKDFHVFHTIIAPFVPVQSAPAGPASSLTYTVSATMPPYTYTPHFAMFCWTAIDATGVESFPSYVTNPIDLTAGLYSVDFTIPLGPPGTVHRRVYWRLGPYRTPWFYCITEIGDNTTTTFTHSPFGTIAEEPTLSRHPPPNPPTQVTGYPATATVPVVVQSATGGTSHTPGTFYFKVSGLYENGQETAPSPVSAGTVLDGVHKIDVTTLPTFPDYLGFKCVFRKLYYCFGSSTFVTGVAGFTTINGNVTTSASALGIENHAWGERPLDASTSDGPYLEDTDLPEALTPTNTTMLREGAGQPFGYTEDGSQIRNRVYVKGNGSTLSAAFSIGATTVAVLDASLFDIAGGQVYVEPYVAGPTASSSIKSVLDYTTITGNTITLKTPTTFAALKGAPVSLWVETNDVASQTALSNIELNDDGTRSDGVHEFFISDPAMQSAYECQIRGYAELSLFSRSIIQVRYSTRDPKTKTGKKITIDMNAGEMYDSSVFDPNIFDCNDGLVGEFLIQDVTIDQINMNGPDEAVQLVQRYTVMASNVRFNLDDLLHRVQLT